jgi:hypothetical protein
MAAEQCESRTDSARPGKPFGTFALTRSRSTQSDEKRHAIGGSAADSQRGRPRLPVSGKRE